MLILRRLDHDALAELVRRAEQLEERTLPVAPEAREALELFYLRDQPTETVCERLGLKPADFYLVLSRARKRFRELLGEHGIREAV